MKKRSSLHIPPTHPGEDLLELIQDHGLTQYRLAKELDVPQTRITQIVKGRRAISADTALRLARYFGMSKEYWLRRQMNYELERAELAMGENILRTVQPLEKVARVT